MIPVAFTRSGFEAKVMAAHLGAEGVVWELRGDVDGLYPVGGIEVLVPSDEADLARDVLATALEDGEIPRPAGSLATVTGRRPRPRSPSPPWRWSSPSWRSACSPWAELPVRPPD